MQLSLELATALNEQLGRERKAHATYRALADALETLNFPGMAKWMRKSSNEEAEHADKFAAYLADRGAQPDYATVEGIVIGSAWTPDAFFDEALKLEQLVTAALTVLYDIADSTTKAFLNWFLLEQVESEKTLEEIGDNFKRAGLGLGYVIMDEKIGEMAGG